MTKEKIINDFEKNLTILEALKPRLKTLIEILIKENAIIVHDVQARVKEKKSLENKISKKEDKYNELKDITDIVGIRIITYFNIDVDLIAKIIEKEFKIDEENSVDKRITDPDRFGYSSLHFVVEFKEERLEFIEYKDFKDIKFEIQIRSILQHAWAEIEHDLGYKTKNELPEGIRRDFSRISSLLEIADNEFYRIKEFLENYEKEVELKLENQTLNVAIDKISLSEYMEKSSIVDEISNSMENIKNNVHIENYYSYKPYNLGALSHFNIKTIAELDSILQENKESIISFFEKWLSDDNELMHIDKSTVLFYLFYVLTYKNFDKEDFVEYMKMVGFNNVLMREILLDFENLKKEDFII
ncbi:hypothetical protein AUC31_17450 [Planococcus rifietoensis]|uniref:RelA/SpoT domain-containing protein n=1 Tax=Planococcus rifietoensis TaxID=200991 RepID=A0A0U2YZA3_9BACL|nr:hypothetical protein [Planococcus rifietoensis]ALS76894.1 hypothetical protein AUC31_17450 [Planococcus rifietoensis]